MIWRTCGSVSASSARSAYSTRAVGFCGPMDTTPSAVLRVGVVADLAQPAGQLGGRAEGRHPVAADEPGDRRVVDTRLLRQLALRHLLGLELGSQPFVECAAVLGRHARLGLGSRVPCAGSTAVSSAWSVRPNHPLVPRAGALRVGTREVWWGRVRSGREPVRGMVRDPGPASRGHRRPVEPQPADGRLDPVGEPLAARLARDGVQDRTRARSPRTR